MTDLKKPYNEVQTLGEFTAACVRAEAFAQSLILIFDAMHHLKGEDRKKAISAARMLSYELDGIGSDLERDVRECFGNGSEHLPGYANVKEDGDV